MDSSTPPLPVICLNTDVHVRTTPAQTSVQLHPPSFHMIESIGNRGAWSEEEQVLLSTFRATTAFSHLTSVPPSMAADLPPPSLSYSPSFTLSIRFFP